MYISASPGDPGVVPRRRGSDGTSGARPQLLWMRGLFGSSMDAPPASPPAAPAPAPRPSKVPEHELRDRARAAKLRAKAAKARLKSNRLEAKAKLLSEKASYWEQRADDLDGVVRPQPQPSVAK